MSFLLDTGIVAEWTRPRPHPGVIAWLASADEDRVFISVATLSELRQGLEHRPDDRRRRRLNEWLQRDLPLRFEGRLLVIDQAVADAAGRIMASLPRGGAQKLSERDAFVAATAMVRQLALVTHRGSLLKPFVPGIVNPWERRRAQA